MERRDMLKSLGLGVGFAVLPAQSVGKLARAKHDLSLLKVDALDDVRDFPKSYNKLVEVVEKIVNSLDGLSVLE
jgi:hypothetical protein